MFFDHLVNDCDNGVEDARFESETTAGFFGADELRLRCKWGIRVVYALEDGSINVTSFEFDNFPPVHPGSGAAARPHINAVTDITILLGVIFMKNSREQPEESPAGEPVVMDVQIAEISDRYHVGSASHAESGGAESFAYLCGRSGFAVAGASTCLRAPDNLPVRFSSGEVIDMRNRGGLFALTNADAGLTHPCDQVVPLIWPEIAGAYDHSQSQYDPLSGHGYSFKTDMHGWAEPFMKIRLKEAAADLCGRSGLPVWSGASSCLQGQEGLSTWFYYGDFVDIDDLGRPFTLPGAAAAADHLRDRSGLPVRSEITVAVDRSYDQDHQFDWIDAADTPLVTRDRGSLSDGISTSGISVDQELKSWSDRTPQAYPLGADPENRCYAG